MGVGVVAERYVVEGRLSRIRKSKLPLAFTQKARLKRLEEYRNEYGQGEEDFWYRYLQVLNNYGLKYMGVMLLLGVLAFLI